jgi:zinc transporter ZupT
LDIATRALAERWQTSLQQTRLTGKVGGVLLVLHSFRDGMAIGVSYAASHSAGYAVAAGIAAHDLGDGMNTVILTTGGEPAKRSDFLFLLADSLAPLLGGFATAWWIFSARNSVILLATAGGFFLQMATNTFLPRVQGEGPSRISTFAAMLCGVGLIYAANLLLRSL